MIYPTYSNLNNLRNALLGTTLDSFAPTKEIIIEDTDNVFEPLNFIDNQKASFSINVTADKVVAIAIGVLILGLAASCMIGAFLPSFASIGITLCKISFVFSGLGSFLGVVISYFGKNQVENEISDMESKLTVQELKPREIYCLEKEKESGILLRKVLFASSIILTALTAISIVGLLGAIYSIPFTACMCTAAPLMFIGSSTILASVISTVEYQAEKFFSQRAEIQEERSDDFTYKNFTHFVELLNNATSKVCVQHIKDRWELDLKDLYEPSTQDNPGGRFNRLHSSLLKTKASLETILELLEKKEWASENEIFKNLITQFNDLFLEYNKCFNKMDELINETKDKFFLKGVFDALRCFYMNCHRIERYEKLLDSIIVQFNATYEVFKAKRLQKTE